MLSPARSHQDAVDLDQPQPIRLERHGEHPGGLEAQLGEPGQSVPHQGLPFIERLERDLGLERGDSIEDGGRALDNFHVEALSIDLQVDPRVRDVPSHLVEYIGEGPDVHRQGDRGSETVGGVWCRIEERVELRHGEDPQISGPGLAAQRAAVAAPAPIVVEDAGEHFEALGRRFERDDVALEPDIVSEGSGVTASMSTDVDHAIDMESVEQHAQVARERAWRGVPGDGQTHLAAGPMDGASDPVVSPHAVEAQSRRPPRLTTDGWEGSK